jgi:putative membrane protein
VLSILSALAYAIAGIAVFAISLVLVARILPGDLWRQALVEKNLHAAIILAGIALALGWIVAAAVH